MTDRTLQVITKFAWGNNRIWPVNDLAKKFVEVIGQKTFTVDNLKAIKKLGYEVEFVGNAPEGL